MGFKFFQQLHLNSISWNVKLCLYGKMSRYQLVTSLKHALEQVHFDALLN
jgi:hypothetical protein